MEALMDLEASGFQLPESVTFEEDTLTDFYGKLIVEPLERGYGITIGNAVRRVLLSSIEGAAITSIKIDNVSHEFSTIKGVQEDVVEVVLNLKKVRLRMHADGEIVATLNIRDKTEVTAADIEFDSRVELLTPDMHIATLEKGAELKAEMHIRKGRGYVSSEEVDKKDLPIGTIAVDAIYTPVRKVLFNVEKTRVGKSTDFDKLLLEIWTDGSITPKKALSKATRILQRHMKFFLLDDEDENDTQEDTEDEYEGAESSDAHSDEAAPRVLISGSEDMNKNLLKSVDELELSVRSQNCLKNAEIKYIYELVQMDEHDMLKMKNFGKKSFNEIRDVLSAMGLDFNARIDLSEIKKEISQKNGG
jgi:DNA-directed RNA polymerase subunit alpha